MDNKRWYSRFGTIFWWCLAILPLIVVLIHFIGYHLTFNSGISVASDLAEYHTLNDGDFFHIFSWYLVDNPNLSFYECQLPFINDMYLNLFRVINLDSLARGEISSLFGWMTSVAFYHVIFDFAVWIFNWIHALFDRWGCFK